MGPLCGVRCTGRRCWGCVWLQISDDICAEIEPDYELVRPTASATPPDQHVSVDAACEDVIAISVIEHRWTVVSRKHVFSLGAWKVDRTRLGECDRQCGRAGATVAIAGGIGEILSYDLRR